MKKIFISSTFQDMQAERDMVQERVLPILNEQANKYGENVGVVDLRWGVDTSTLETDEGAQKVLSVCLDEIDKSQPYMLVFLGERYGWIPDSSLIERAVQSKGESCTITDYEKSVTALEIEYGVLSQLHRRKNKCVICLRESVAYQMPEEYRAIYEEQNEVGRTKLKQIKDRLINELGNENCVITYSAKWDETARSLKDFSSDGRPLEDVLIERYIEMFKEEWETLEKLSWQEREQLAFRAVIEHKLKPFVGRGDVLFDCTQRIRNELVPLMLCGDVGAGKTSIMCKLIEQLQNEGEHVFTFFAGEGKRSGSANDLVLQMVYYLENLLELDFRYTQEDSYERSLIWLKRLCDALPSGKKVYFFIDGLEQLEWDEHVKKLDFLIEHENVKMICSFQYDYEIPYEDCYFGRAIINEVARPRSVITLSRFNQSDIRAVIDAQLLSLSKNSYEEIENEIIRKEQSNSPLYVSLLVRRLNMMDASELYYARTEREIITLGKKIIQEMPDNLGEATVAIIERAIEKTSDKKEQLYKIINYISVAQNGLRLEEIKGCLPEEDILFSELDFVRMMQYLDDQIFLERDGRICFTLFEAHINWLYKVGYENAKQYCKNVLHYIKTLPQTHRFYLQEGMYFALCCDDKEFAKKLLGVAEKTKNAELLKGIRRIGIEDFKRINEESEREVFYCRIIKKEESEDSLVCKFFTWWLTQKKSYVSREEQKMYVLLAICLVEFREKMYQLNASIENLLELGRSYKDCYRCMYNTRLSFNGMEYLEKAIETFKICYENNPSRAILEELYLSCIEMEKNCKGHERYEKAITYYQDGLHYAIKLLEEDQSEEALWTLIEMCEKGFLFYDPDSEEGEAWWYNPSEDEEGKIRTQCLNLRADLKIKKCIYSEQYCEQYREHKKWWRLETCYRLASKEENQEKYLKERLNCLAELEKIEGINQKEAWEIASRYEIIAEKYKDLGYVDEFVREGLRKERRIQ